MAHDYGGEPLIKGLMAFLSKTINGAWRSLEQLSMSIDDIEVVTFGAVINVN
jgi:hypothetical protein